MVTLLRSCFLPFAVALLIGMAAGRMAAPAKAADPVLASKNERETPLRVQRGRLDWEDPLREYEAEDHREIETGLDAMDRLLDGWSADELRTALDKALQTPECVDPMGAGDRRIDELFGAWIRRDPHAAAASVVDVHSGGRIGRLWHTLVPYRYQPAFEFVPIESLIREMQSDYYAVLDACDRAGSSTAFVGFGNTDELSGGGEGSRTLV